MRPETIHLERIVGGLYGAWGIGGVVGLLMYSVITLSPRAFEALAGGLSWQQWLLAAAWCAYMVYSEGYKAFQKEFAPKVVRRAGRLRANRPFFYGIAAPLYCMGHIGAGRRQTIIIWSATAGIIGLVLLVGLLPQPWRGIADLGVVLGLGYGIGCIGVQVGQTAAAHRLNKTKQYT